MSKFSIGSLLIALVVSGCGKSPSHSQLRSDTVKDKLSLFHTTTGYEAACSDSSFSGGKVSLAQCISGIDKLIAISSKIGNKHFTRIFVGTRNVETGDDLPKLTDVVVSTDATEQEMLFHLRKQPDLSDASDSIYSKIAKVKSSTGYLVECSGNSTAGGRVSLRQCISGVDSLLGIAGQFGAKQFTRILVGTQNINTGDDLPSLYDVAIEYGATKQVILDHLLSQPNSTDSISAKISDFNASSSYEGACSRNTFSGGRVSLAQCIRGFDKLLAIVGQIKGKQFKRVFVGTMNADTGGDELTFLYDVAIDYRATEQDILLHLQRQPSSTDSVSKRLIAFKEMTGYLVRCSSGAFEGGRVSLAQCIKGLDSLLSIGNQIGKKKFYFIFVGKENIDTGAGSLGLGDVAVNSAASPEDMLKHLQKQP